LTEHDAQAFAEFESSASPQDLDDAYVELGHWAVFGAFVQDRLVSVASAYPWLDAHIADIGVLTLPGFRGRNHGRAVVRALCKFAAQQAYQPQYRCQFEKLLGPRVASARRRRPALRPEIHPEARHVDVRARPG
jgi:GNAT superfamily N-acetyltransferase